MAEQSSNAQRQAQAENDPEKELEVKKHEVSAQSAEQAKKTTKKDDGNPGEAREDPSVPTWTDKETGTVYKQGDAPVKDNPLEDGSLDKDKSKAHAAAPDDEAKGDSHESMMDKAKHMLHHEK